MRAIYLLAQEIRWDWKNMSVHAKPYVDAMITLVTMDDTYGMDSADSIIRYFLANAGTWRGETAKRIKAELKEMIKN